MAREKNYDRAIEIVDEKIADTEVKLTNLKAQKSALLEERKQQDVEKLLAAINDKGMSVEEACDILVN